MMPEKGLYKRQGNGVFKVDALYKRLFEKHNDSGIRTKNSHANDSTAARVSSTESIASPQLRHQRGELDEPAHTAFAPDLGTVNFDLGWPKLDLRHQGGELDEPAHTAFSPDLGTTGFDLGWPKLAGLVVDPIQSLKTTSSAGPLADTRLRRSNFYGNTTVSGQARAILGNYEHHEHHHHHEQQQLPVLLGTSAEQNQAFVNAVILAATQYKIPMPSGALRKDPRTISEWVAEVIEAHVCASSIADGQSNDVLASHTSSNFALAPSTFWSAASHLPNDDAAELHNTDVVDEKETEDKLQRSWKCSPCEQQSKESNFGTPALFDAHIFEHHSATFTQTEMQRTRDVCQQGGEVTDSSDACLIDEGLSKSDSTSSASEYYGGELFPQVVSPLQNASASRNSTNFQDGSDVAQILIREDDDKRRKKRRRSTSRDSAETAIPRKVHVGMASKEEGGMSAGVSGSRSFVTQRASESSPRPCGSTPPRNAGLEDTAKPPYAPDCSQDPNEAYTIYNHQPRVDASTSSSHLPAIAAGQRTLAKSLPATQASRSSQQTSGQVKIRSAQVFRMPGAQFRKFSRLYAPCGLSIRDRNSSLNRADNVMLVAMFCEHDFVWCFAVREDAVLSVPSTGTFSQDLLFTRYVLYDSRRRPQFADGEAHTKCVDVVPVFLSNIKDTISPHCRLDLEKLYRLPLGIGVKIIGHVIETSQMYPFSSFIVLCNNPQLSHIWTTTDTCQSHDSCECREGGPTNCHLCSRDRLDEIHRDYKY